jgi:hypothetical protein
MFVKPGVLPTQHGVLSWCGQLRREPVLNIGCLRESSGRTKR